MGTIEDLISGLRATCAGLPDKRRGKNIQYLMADIGMTPFSVFFMQSPSFLAHQRQFEEGHGRSNCASLFGITKIPSTPRRRSELSSGHFDATWVPYVGQPNRVATSGEVY